MKKVNHPIHNAFMLVVFIVLTCAAVTVVIELLSTPRNAITNMITDEHGLTSVIYIQDGKEWALDYLTVQELDSLKTALNNQ